MKIQVEFNPAKVSEYRLIGYETRALNREDFNNDRVDAGEIGSGHSVTAIYEITPKGSPASMIDDLRYGEATVEQWRRRQCRRICLREDPLQGCRTSDVSQADHDAGDRRPMRSRPSTQASVDQRFSVAVAAFGQKLRNADQTAKFGYDKIMEIATAARGADPFGYRSEFLSLVRLASALDSGNR